MQKCVFLPYTPFEIFAREYMEYFHKDKFNCKKNQNWPIVANVRYLLIWEVKMGDSKERFKHNFLQELQCDRCMLLVKKQSHNALQSSFLLQLK